MKGRTTMERSHQLPRSQLFMVRLWPEELSPGEIEWRGKVQHVSSGRVSYFRDWATLTAHLQSILEHIEAQHSQR